MQSYTPVAGLNPFRLLVLGEEQDGTGHQPGQLLILQSSGREEIIKFTQYKEVCSELWIILLPSWLQGPQEGASQGEKKWKGEVGSSQQGQSVGQAGLLFLGCPFPPASSRVSLLPL